MNRDLVDVSNHQRIADLGQRIIRGGSVDRAEGEWFFELENGADVFVCSRTREEIEETVEALSAKGNAAGKLCDVRVEDQVGDFVLHVEREAGEAFRLGGEKLEKIPLRHESNELAARRQTREVSDADIMPVDDSS